MHDLTQTQTVGHNWDQLMRFRIPDQSFWIRSCPSDIFLPTKLKFRRWLDLPVYNKMNPEKPPLYPRQVPTKASRKRKAEASQGIAVKRPKLCRKRKQQDDKAKVINPHKRTRLGEDQEEVLFGLLVLEMHDVSELICYDSIDFQPNVQSLHLGSIWLPDSTHGLVSQSLRLSHLGSTWISHPKYGVLRRSCRISTSSR